MCLSATGYLYLLKSIFLQFALEIDLLTLKMTLNQKKIIRNSFCTEKHTKKSYYICS